MSLTSQLRDPTSPVSRWMAGRVDRAAAAALVDEVNAALAGRAPIVADRGDPRLVGRAFDYAFRWRLGPLEAQAARLGALLCAGEGWPGAPELVAGLIRGGTDTGNPRVRLRACVVLSWFEEVMRSGEVPPPLRASWGAPGTRETAIALLKRVPPGPLADLEALLRHVADDWGADLGAPLRLNPTFAGSDDVGGADADWIVGTTLWDCKVSWVRWPFARAHLLQGLGYILLDYDDAYGLTALGWYFPRQRARVARSLTDTVQVLCGSGDLGALRADFRAALTAPPVGGKASP